LGTSDNNSPGEVLDKVARKLKLHQLNPVMRDMSGTELVRAFVVLLALKFSKFYAGGRALEIVSEGGDPLAVDFPIMMSQHR
jgi:hypothetical protein